MAVTRLPDVDWIRGAALEGRATPQESQVRVQYSDHKDDLFEVWMPFPAAMYLLDILQQMKKEAGIYP